MRVITLPGLKPWPLLLLRIADEERLELDRGFTRESAR